MDWYVTEHVATMGRLWFLKSLNVFVTKAYCLLCWWFEVFYVFWAGKLVNLAMQLRLALVLRRAFSPFLSIPQRQVDPMYFLQLLLFFIKTFAVISPKAHPISCRGWEESSHHAELARYFLEHFVTSAVCRLVCRKPFSCAWHVLFTYLGSAWPRHELERNLLQDLILFFFWGVGPLWVYSFPLHAFRHAHVDLFCLTDSLNNGISLSVFCLQDAAVRFPYEWSVLVWTELFGIYAMLNDIQNIKTDSF